MSAFDPKRTSGPSRPEQDGPRDESDEQTGDLWSSCHATISHEELPGGASAAALIGGLDATGGPSA